MLLVGPHKISVDAAGWTLTETGERPLSLSSAMLLMIAVRKSKALEPFKGLLVPLQRGWRNVVEVLAVLDDKPQGKWSK
jgi:hypothetical protein